MAYNPYSDIKKVYDAKVGWNKATTDQEKQRQSAIATAARKNLEAYGYSDIASQISANGATADVARKIMEQYAPQKTSTVVPKATTAPDSTTLSNSELITTNNNETRNKINQLWGTQTKDREVMAGKYDKLESTAYENPFETEEGKAIIGKYDLKALQGRENELASGGSSNGGNIDSYAAANALRQQAALTSKGQMVALDAHNNKINNVKGILESLGVYQQNQDKGMQTTIGLQSNEGQRLFENEQTVLNNDVARKSEIATVTGTVPDEWVVSNNPYMNEDGTIKDEYKDIDFSAVMAKAKASGNTNAYNAAATARYYKIMGDYGAYGQYDDGNYIVPGEKQTEAGRQFDKTMDYNYKALDTEVSMNNANNQNAIEQIITSSQLGATKPTLTASQAKDAIKSGEINDTTIAAYNYYFGGNYTTDNPPSIVDGKTTEPPLSEKEVTEWVEFLNNEVSKNYGTNASGEPYKALTQTGKNTYKRADMDADYIIINVMGSDDLTQEQKEFLLYNKFGITEDEVNTAMKDKHYR